MHLSLASTLLLISICNIDAFSSSSAAAVRRTPVTSSSNLLYATVQAAVEEKKKDDVEIRLESWAQKCGYEFPNHVSPLTGEEINARRDAQLQKMRMKDKTSTFLEKEVRC